VVLPRALRIATDHLVSSKDNSGQTTVSLWDRLVQDTSETNMGSITQKGASALTKH
jgi:hypothetical protein